jgi:hypothetical protein
LEGLATEVVGIFYGHLVYFTAPLVYFVAFWYILWLFGVCIFPRFGMLHEEKSGNPGATNSFGQIESDKNLGGGLHFELGLDNRPIFTT